MVCEEQRGTCISRVLDLFSSVQFSSVKDGIFALVEAHMLCTSSLRGFPNDAFEMVPMFVSLTVALSRPFKDLSLERKKKRMVGGGGGGGSRGGCRREKRKRKKEKSGRAKCVCNYYYILFLFYSCMKARCMWWCFYNIAAVMELDGHSSKHVCARQS